jgi:hypothetical protein
MARWCTLAIVAAALTSTGSVTSARNDDGRYADSELKKWFDGLASEKGLCCSFADGRSIADVDWDTAAVAGADGDTAVRYRVRIDGQWIVVPPEALITEPNRYGPAVAWPYKDSAGVTQIRCFMPSSMS